MSSYNLGEAIEESTFIVKVAFTDENGSAITPDSLVWSLTDGKGNYINSRQSVTVSGVASTNYVVLKGDDLAIGTYGRGRILTAEAVYSSATYGDDLPLKDSAEFIIKDLVAVS